MRDHRKRSFRHDTKYRNAVGDAVRDMIESGVIKTQTVKANNSKHKTVLSVVDQGS